MRLEIPRLLSGHLLWLELPGLLLWLLWLPRLLWR